MSNLVSQVKAISSLYTLLHFWESENVQKILSEMESENFEDIDVLNLTQEQEDELRKLYELSVQITRLDIFSEKIAKPFENIRKRLEPLFADTTEYLLREPNASKIQQSLQEVSKGRIVRYEY